MWVVLKLERVASRLAETERGLAEARKQLLELRTRHDRRLSL